MRLFVVADTTYSWPEGTDGRYDLSVLVDRYSPDVLLSLGDFSMVHAAVMARSGAPPADARLDEIQVVERP